MDASAYDQVAGVIGYTTAKEALSKKECYEFFGFKSAAEAEARLNRTPSAYVDRGMMQVRTVDGTVEFLPNSPAHAQTIDNGTGGPNRFVIEINLSANWFDPSRTSVFNVTTGRTQTVNLQRAIGDSIGRPGLTGVEFRTLTILHEFKHVLGAPQEGSNSTYNRDIADKCL
jgi:hypothetical protein